MDDAQSENLPAVVTEKLPASASMETAELVKLAREIAMDIHSVPVVLARFNLSAEQYEQIEKVPYYTQILQAFRIEWNSALSTQERMKIEAAVLLEDALPKIGARMQKESESLDHAVKAGQLLTKLAGIGEEKGSAGGAEKFQININLGADTKLSFEKDITPTPPIEAGAEEVRVFPKGKVGDGPVQIVAKGPGDAAPVPRVPKRKAGTT